jgi:suppressor of G2 allele of SKP1
VLEKPTTTTQQIRHEWFQNENFVTVSVFIKNTKKDDVNIDFHPRALSVTIKLPATGSDYTLELDPLSHEIVPAESKYSVLGTKIEIKLKKAMVGIRWNNLEGEDDGLTQKMAGTAEAPPAYPSSSKKVRTAGKHKLKQVCVGKLSLTYYCSPMVICFIFIHHLLAPRLGRPFQSC